MELSDKKDFGIALSNTLEVCRAPITESLIATWFKALARCELRDVAAALEEHVEGEQKSPVPADISKIALREQNRREYEAWSVAEQGRLAEQGCELNRKLNPDGLSGPAGALAALRNAGLVVTRN